MPVRETAEDRIEELTKQLNEAKITIKKLNKENQKLKIDKYHADFSKESLKKDLETLQQEKEELRLKLKDAHKKYLQKLLEKGELCDNDCVLCSLLWICHHKLQVYPCGRHLEKILTIKAEQKNSGTNPVHLCCEKFMHILIKCRIVVNKFEWTFLAPGNEIDDRYREEQIDKVWQKFLTVDAKKLVVMVGRVFSEPGRPGHMIVCDLKKRDKGLLEYNDLQNDVEGKEVDEEAFKNGVRNDEGISLFIVNTDKLQEIIDEHKDILHTTNYKANPTGTSSSCTHAARNMLPSLPAEPNSLLAIPTTKRAVCNTNSAADDTEHAAAYVPGSLPAIPITEPVADCAACDTERAACDTDSAACDTKHAACGTNSVACDAERAACDTDSAAYDTKHAACGTNSVACDTERAACDTDSAACDTKHAACGTNSVACDTDGAAYEAERAACDTDSAAYEDL